MSFKQEIMVDGVKFNSHDSEGLKIDFQKWQPVFVIKVNGVKIDG